MEVSLKCGVTMKGGSGRLHHRTDNRIRSPRLAAYGTTGEGKLGNSAKWTRNFGIRVASFWQFVSEGIAWLRSEGVFANGRYVGRRLANPERSDCLVKTQR